MTRAPSGDPRSVGFNVRVATIDDAPRIAVVHVDSIRTLGASSYPEAVVQEWGQPRDGKRYADAMAGGERMFVAVRGEGTDSLLGFSSWRVAEGKHRVAVYVSGAAARQGVGTALLGAAEAVARENAGEAIDVAASLVAVDFYRANGFDELATGEHALRSGRKMACVFMRKTL